MTDPLADLLDHPPQDPSPAASLQFTAAVMSRVAELPLPTAHAPARRFWWLAAALVAFATFAIPSDLSAPNALIDSVPAVAPLADAVPAAADTDALAVLAPLTDPTVLIDATASVLALGAIALILRTIVERNLDRPRSLVTP